MLYCDLCIIHVIIVLILWVPTTDLSRALFAYVAVWTLCSNKVCPVYTHVFLYLALVDAVPGFSLRRCRQVPIRYRCLLFDQVSNSVVYQRLKFNMRRHQAEVDNCWTVRQSLYYTAISYIQHSAVRLLVAQQAIMSCAGVVVGREGGM